MSLRSLPLAQFRIEEPCTEAWDAMSGDAVARHCDKCQKQVHDLSEMDQAEAQALLGSGCPVCVRMRQDAAGRILTREHWKVAAGAALAVGIGMAAPGGMADDAAGDPKVVHVERQDAPPPVIMGKICPVPPPAPAPEAAPAPAEPAKDLKMFPAAKEGYKRVVIRLPKLEDEHAAQVEIVATRVVNVDAVNRHSLGGAMEEKVVQGWGYNYYEMTVGKAVASTMMAGSPEQMQPRPTPVAVRGKGFQGLRYNSRLPLVVYAPADVEVKYRVWTPGEAQAAPVE